MRTLCLTLLTFFSLHFYAQDQTNNNNNSRPHRNDPRSRLHLGIKAGINKSNVYDSQGDAFAANPKYGFAGGAFLQIPIGRFLGIHPEVLFSQKGFKGTGMVAGLPYNMTRTSSFIDVPLLVAFKPIRWVYLVAGPQFSYLASQSDVFHNGTNTFTQEQAFRNDNIRKNILGAVIGVDVNIGNLVIGGRYSWDMQTNNGNGTSSTPRYKNTYVQATLGFKLF